MKHFIMGNEDKVVKPDVWQIKGVEQTTKMDHIKTHYFTSHKHLNCYAIIPRGPDFIGQLEK